MEPNSPSRASVETEPYIFQYEKFEKSLHKNKSDYIFSLLIDRDVCYITLCEKNFPKKNAFGYLEDLAQEFNAQFGQRIQLAARPYSFIEFGLLMKIAHMKSYY